MAMSGAFLNFDTKDQNLEHSRPPLSPTRSESSIGSAYSSSSGSHGSLVQGIECFVPNSPTSALDVRIMLLLDNNKTQQLMHPSCPQQQHQQQHQHGIFRSVVHPMMDLQERKRPTDDGVIPITKEPPMVDEEEDDDDDLFSLSHDDSMEMLSSFPSFLDEDEDELLGLSLVDDCDHHTMAVEVVGSSVY